MIYLFHWAIWALYAVAFFQYLKDFRDKNQVSGTLINLPIFTVAVSAHLVFFLVFLVINGRIQVASLSEAMASFVLFTSLTYWVLERRLHETSMGTFILPVLLITLALSNVLYAPPENISPILLNYTFEIHVLCMLFSYGAFTLAFIASLLQYLLSRELRKLSMGVFYSRLPSIAFFERISNAAVDTGLFFMIAGFLLGLYGAAQVWQNLMTGDPKFYSALMTIVIFAFHAISRRWFSWQGDRAAIIAIFGFGWILVSFLIISLLFTNQHQFV